MSAQPYLRADEIHARVDWPSVLAQLGIAEEFLRKKAGPCPVCGGRDRYTFDNRSGRGDFFCRHCGAGDGFELLRRVHGWPFAEARREVMRASGTSAECPTTPARVVARAVSVASPAATPSGKVRALVRSACAVADCQDAVRYLESRRLWPLPEGCALKAHPSVEYWHEGTSVGRFPALVAEVRDMAGELVTAHVTYLSDGKKLATNEPRKILTPMTGRTGCAIRLMPLPGDTIGVAEGIETALSAAVIDGVPVWAALNTSLLTKFVPPPGLSVLRIYADADVSGLEAAARLMERLQAFVRLELRVPQGAHKDFNSQLTSEDRKRD